MAKTYFVNSAAASWNPFVLNPDDTCNGCSTLVLTVPLVTIHLVYDVEVPGGFLTSMFVHMVAALSSCCP